jgi:hypothetical protein
LAGFLWPADAVEKSGILVSVAVFRPRCAFGGWPTVSIQPAGVIWAEAEIKRITARNVIVRYADEMARLDREKLWKWWAFWRGVRFVSSRTGRIAQELDAAWQRHHGRAAG